MTVQPYFALQQPISPWCNSKTKRVLDIAFASSALVVTAPLMLLTTIAIRATSRGPALFRQWRVGLNGHPFQLLKFRTMKTTAPESGPGVTRAGDARITWIGRRLREWKLDELPQLINVLRGEMSIVGPRPDLDEFWRQATDVERQALAVKPGLTGAATLVFSNEQKLLAQIPAPDLVVFYVRDLLPRKARLDCEYAARANFVSDCRVLLKTVAGMISPSLVRASPQQEISRAQSGNAANRKWNESAERDRLQM
jgi:lipopolysaccharide/colanic/teichoic acid biosynthesis glycosyltransferase